MRRAERLFRLVDEMRTRSISRADDLANHLEVSTRTIYRDIAHLQASGLPIEGAAGVGYLLRPGFDLPSVTFTHAQLDALAIGLAFAENLEDPQLALAAREVRAKLQASMPQPEARKLADAPYFAVPRRPRPDSLATTDLARAPISAQTDALRDAIRTQRVVAACYSDANGKITQRRLRPLAIWTLADGAMVTAWCELRETFRTFRLDRITQLTVTDARFVPEPGQDLAAFLKMDNCTAES
ncbi:DNA-binding transcriptional regulator [Cypionkella aquatica]|uniref:DNA-binding transcriptional regulator n=1 Tax=Cypionkella aquatica TaxID=1756042 RepID=A0AA37X289_9RHOB|nr:YafY family protein [Cypionkella aquatica]GLS88697.1 DNA-binding transcriptional regulator [Cypionkella aquatica]